MTIHSNHIKDLFSLLFFLAVTLFWWLCYPQALNIQEENQLFLWSFDYFHERMSLPGGLADWIGECLTQFFYLPWLGALILGVLAVAVQRLTERLLPKGWMSTVLSLLPPGATILWLEHNVYDVPSPLHFRQIFTGDPAPRGVPTAKFQSASAS